MSLVVISVNYSCRVRFTNVNGDITPMRQVVRAENVGTYDEVPKFESSVMKHNVPLSGLAVPNSTFPIMQTTMFALWMDG